MAATSSFRYRSAAVIPRVASKASCGSRRRQGTSRTASSGWSLRPTACSPPQPSAKWRLWSRRTGPTTRCSMRRSRHIRWCPACSRWRRRPVWNFSLRQTICCARSTGSDSEKHGKRIGPSGLMRFFFCMAKVIIGAMPDKKVKKILIFSLAYYPHVGGAEVAVKEITDRITGIEFHMVTMRMDSSPRESLEGRVHVYRIGLGNKSRLNKFLFQFLAAHKASKLHKHYHYDAIWALMAHSAGMPAVLFKMKHKEVPYLLNLQEGDPPAYIERTMRPLWPLFIAAFRRADVVQPISTFLAAWARKMGYTGPIEIIPNGVDVKRFSGIPVAHKGIILITSSRLVHKNAVDDVIRALALLP